MNLSEIVSITKMTGLYQVMKKRTDGLIVKSLIDDKSTFVSQRSNMFTPLDNITIYTQGEPIELKEVFRSMKALDAQNVMADPKADGATLRQFMAKVVPNYDEERVYTSDIVKLIKWYQLLKSRNLLVEEEVAAPVQEAAPASEEEKPAKKTRKKAAATTEEAEVKEEKPKKKSSKKTE